MKKTFLLLLTVAFVHLQASHFRNSITVTAQANNEYLVEVSIETIGPNPEVLALPVIHCHGNVPAKLLIGTEESGYLIEAQVMQNETEKKVYTSLQIKRNGEVLDVSEHVVKFVK